MSATLRTSLSNPMHSFKSFLWSALVCFSLINPRVSYGQVLQQQTLYEALTQHGLRAYAQFLLQYAPEIAERKNLLVYAPNDAAVAAYLALNPQPPRPVRSGINVRDASPHKIVPRAASSNGNTAANSNTGPASNGGNSFQAAPARGSTGGGGTSGAKVSRPAGGGGKRRALNFVGTITSGGGTTSFVLQDATPYNNGFFFEIDSFTALGQSFQATLTDPKIAHLATILLKVPRARDIIFRSINHTFFLPTLAALRNAGLDPDTASVARLQEFIENHAIVNSPRFIGYTPEFRDGVCYKVWSGRGITATFTGLQTILNGHATILIEDIITNSGVIQVIDQVLFDDRNPGCT